MRGFVNREFSPRAKTASSTPCHLVSIRTRFRRDAGVPVEIRLRAATCKSNFSSKSIDAVSGTGCWLSSEGCSAYRRTFPKWCSFRLLSCGGPGELSSPGGGWGGAPELPVSRARGRQAQAHTLWHLPSWPAPSTRRVPARRGISPRRPSRRRGRRRTACRTSAWRA